MATVYLMLPAVSIHTPTRGVTDDGHAFNGFEWVSIHTPTRGVTLLSVRRELIHPVSIHTPTRGVTHHWTSAITTLQFQSTLPRGE